MRNEKLTSLVIGKAIKVHKSLGMGFLEKVYENALIHELRKLDLKVLVQPKINVFYDGIIVGTYVPDLIIDNCLVLELKATNTITSKDRSQLRNYLNATTIDLGLTINFGTDTLGVRRISLYEN